MDIGDTEEVGHCKGLSSGVIGSDNGGMGGGRGRCNLEAASLSPGDSNATAGIPYVAPNKLASAPPKECPTSQTLADGYI